MDRSEYRRLKKQYRADAKQRWADLKAVRKQRRRDGLTWAERRAARKADRQEIRAWKAEIAAASPKLERKAQRKGYRWFKRRQRRWIGWIAFGVVIALIASLFGWWYASATTPLTDEQAATREASLPVAEQVQAEGSVLLENEGGVLPLRDEPVAMFGIGSVEPVYSGGGAGGISATGAQSLYDAFDEAGIDYDADVRDVYGNWATSGEAKADDWTEPEGGIVETLLPAVGGFLVATPEEMPADELPDDVVAAAAERADTAIYVVSRAGTETIDLTLEQMSLSAAERDTVELLDERFEHVVVLVNSTNVMELGFLEEYEHVDAALWIGGPGETGASAVAAVLTGEVNPSGRTVDTWAYDVESNPAVANTGDFEYTDASGEPSGRTFTDNLEGIYLGYRYYETFVPDAEYDRVVQYPFGYGLSYTDFAWNVVSTSADADQITATVEVTNTGDVAGKDVVQLYYSAPYTPGGIEKSAVALGGYAKTDVIEPGASDTVTVTFATRDMASYDDRDARTWVLEAGAYELQVARDVHDPVASFSWTQSETVVLDTDSATGAEVTNRFDDEVRDDLTWLSRADPAGTAPTAPTGERLELPEGLLDRDYEHVVDPSVEEPTTGAEHGIMLEDLAGLPIDDPKWEPFLDQFTAEELVAFSGNGAYWSIAIDRLGIPRTTMYDGPTSIRSFLEAWASVAFPAPVVLASSWNVDLAHEVGLAMGAEAQAYGVDAVYAPSLDLHRSPLGGRNFEYFSEDPLLTGTLGAAYSSGIQEHGTTTVVKHFAGNLQETNRAKFGLYVWAPEQAWRELYLKPFEITVKQADAHGVMTAFNRVGSTWAGGSAPLLTDILRGEWGFEGFVITDAGIGPQGEHFDALQAVEAGNDLMLDLPLDLPGPGTFEQQLSSYLEEDRAGTLSALRDAARHIAYYVLQTNRI
ncbi:beta-glucosidase [Agromyces sp. CFH 90414]|uniref:Beta-glucosidase n=1 Tax=Agromyces agglutinans TaxID=2662258 RepID=A0A6I2FBE5_9MICO|nr:glycoside hydrolase family 3 N-terminal domain-containing protein [Agromyces agglutinans]MRG59766.1 beta-glucosidase [Agromyces agglutinans]